MGWGNRHLKEISKSIILYSVWTQLPPLQGWLLWERGPRMSNIIKMYPQTAAKKQGPNLRV